MSVTLTHDLTCEPYRLPSGILAVAVHGAFLALLYFGFSWQSLPPAMKSVSVEADLWSSLPEEVIEPPAQAAVEEVVQPVQPEEVVKPDIVLKDASKIVTEPVVPKPSKKKVDTKPVIQKPVEQTPVEQNPGARIAEQQAAREQAANKQAESAAAIDRVVDEYKAKIKAKITRNVVEPPGVAKDAHGIFWVTLLPGGSVLKVELKKSSGNSAYDNAVERAILKSDPLPLPPDTQLFNRFREINFPFHPGE